MTQIQWFKFSPISDGIQFDHPTIGRPVSRGEAVMLPQTVADAINREIAGAGGGLALNPCDAPGWAPKASDAAKVAAKGWKRTGDSNHMNFHRDGWDVRVFRRGAAFLWWLLGPVGPGGKMGKARAGELAAPVGDPAGLVPVDALNLCDGIIREASAAISRSSADEGSGNPDE